MKYEADGYLKGVSDGDIVEGAIWAGQAVVLLDNIESAKEVIDSILEEAERILRGMPEFLS